MHEYDLLVVTTCPVTWRHCGDKSFHLSQDVPVTERPVLVTGRPPVT